MKKTLFEAFEQVQPFLRTLGTKPVDRHPFVQKFDGETYLCTYDGLIGTRVALSTDTSEGLVVDRALLPWLCDLPQIQALPWSVHRPGSRLVEAWNEAVELVRALGRTRKDAGMTGFAATLVWGGRCKGTTIQLQRTGTYRPFHPGEQDVRVDLRSIALVGMVREAALESHDGKHMLSVLTTDGIEAIVAPWKQSAPPGIAPVWVDAGGNGTPHGRVCVGDACMVSVFRVTVEGRPAWETRVYRVPTMQEIGWASCAPRAAGSVDAWLTLNSNAEPSVLARVQEALDALPEVWV